MTFTSIRRVLDGYDPERTIRCCISSYHTHVVFVDGFKLIPRPSAEVVL